MSTVAPEGFSSFLFKDQNIEHTVFVGGSGPAIVIMHELPGMVPETITFARRLQEAGFTTYLPLFFGRPGKKNSTLSDAGYALRLCISREFYLFKRNASSPIVTWLRALCNHAHNQCGGPGVGVIGMCLTGGFALSLLTEPSVIAPVMSQPSLPACPLGSKRAKQECHRELDLSAEELEIAKRRAAEGITIRGYRFTGDTLCPSARFDRLREEFGSAFIPLEIDSSPGNVHGYAANSHAVFTIHYSDEPESPTRKALDGLIDYYQKKLLNP